MKRVKLGNYIEIISGYAFDSKFFNGNDGVGIIRIRDIQRGYTETYTTQKYEKKYIVEKDDLLIGMDGEFNVEKWKSSKALLNQRVCKIIPQNIDKDYVYYLLPVKLKEIERKTPFVTVKHLSIKQIENIEIDWIDINQQKTIGRRLNKIQTIINTKKNQLEKLNHLIKSQFVEMFGNPILNDKNYLYKEIEEISEIVTGTTPDTTNNDNWNGDINWITPAEINNDTFYVFETERKITEKGRKSKSLTLMPKGTVIFSTRAPIGKTAIAGIEMCCNQGFKNCICNENINNIYLYYVLKNNTEYFNNLGTGATFKELSKRVFEKIKISVPPIELQNKFAEFVKQIDKQKFHLQYEERLEVA